MEFSQWGRFSVEMRWIHDDMDSKSRICKNYTPDLTRQNRKVKGRQTSSTVSCARVRAMNRPGAPSGGPWAFFVVAQRFPFVGIFSPQDRICSREKIVRLGSACHVTYLETIVVIETEI